MTRPQWVPTPESDAASRAVWDHTAGAIEAFKAYLKVCPDATRIRHTSPPGPRQIRVTVEVLP